MNKTAKVQRPFAVFDIDGTLIRWQLYHAIVNELAKEGHLEAGAYERIQASRMQWKQRSHSESFKEYEHAVVRAYHDAITELSIDSYMTAVDKVFEGYKDQVYTYTRDLLKSLKKSGYLLFTISGSQQEIISKLADYYGFDAAIGNKYVQHDGKFTGDHQNIVKGKGSILDKLVDQYGATYSGSIAVGDSESDIQMMEHVESPIAFNPSKGLFETAKNKGWKVVVERKNVVYELAPNNGTFYLLQ